MGSTTTVETTKTIEELQAEAQAAQEALDAKQAELKAQQDEIANQQRELESQKKKAEAQAKNQLLIDSLRPHMVAIQQELEKLKVEGVEVRDGVVGDYMPTLPTLNLSYTYKPKFTERRQGSSNWHAGTLVGYNIAVGDYGNKKTFPPKKDGSYSYSKIAENIVSRMAGEKRQVSIEQERKEQISEMEEIAKVVGGSVVSHRYTYNGRYEQCSPTLVLGLELARGLRDKLDQQ